MTVTATPLQTSATADQALRYYAKQDPDRVVLSADGQEVTYAELDREVDATAARLIADLGRRAAFVPLRITATIPMVTTSLAVTRAGMTYVPIDPTAPPDRVLAVLREVDPGLLLSDVESDRQESWPVRLAHPATYRAEPPAGGINEVPADISAVVFTSGSTGTPKGIMHSRAHRESAAQMLREMWADYPPPAECRVGAITVGTVGLADGAAHAALVLGGAFVSYDIRRLGLEPWADWMRRERISTTVLIPTIWRFLAGTLDASVQFPDLTLVAMVGEASSWDDVALLRRHLPPNAYVINILAQTEVGISRFDVTPDTPLGTGRLPAGFPIPNRDLHILGPDGDDVGVGERGEIVVDTFDCAAGYWKLPEATARTFEPLPDGRTRVHTGDAGRLLADGSLEHLGRVDHMVKVSGGNRVELGDVEAGLAGLDGVAAAAAVAVPGSDGDLRLMAAVVLDGSVADPPTGLRLREQLGSVLPKPMLPDRIYLVDELPTLPGGKLDRRGLADDIANGRLGAAAEPAVDGPSDSAHLATVVELYEDVLGRADVGPDSDFFAFGGDSLRAARLMALLGELVGRNLPVSMLLEDPTPRGLVQMLARDTAGGGLLVVIRRGSPDLAPLVLIHDANADVFYARQIVDQLDPDRPILGLRAQTLFRQEPEDTDLPGVAARYVRELRASGYHGPWLIYGYSMGGTIGFEMACQLQAAGDDVRLLALGDAPGPLPKELVGRSQWRFRVTRRWHELSSRSAGEALRHVGWLAGRQARYAKNVTLRAARRIGGARPVDYRKEMEAAVFADGPLAYDTMLSFTATHFSEMLLAYQPQCAFHGDALLFKAESQDDRVSNGWDPHITGAVEVVHVAAPHDSIHRGEAGRQLAARLCEALRRIQPDT